MDFTPRPILIDCDPGIDDAVALAMIAAFREQLSLLGITTVAGNQTLERVTRNALDLAFLLHLEVPVASGCDAPLLRKKEVAADIHGSTGLGDCHLPQSSHSPISHNAVTFLRDVLLSLPQGQKATLLPTGPLTNIALLLKTFPEVKDRIDTICLMGGGLNGGNVTPTAEFNIWADPEAAQMVFSAGLPLVMCGLDATMQGGLTRSQVDALLKGNGTISRYFGEMLDFYFRSPAYQKRDVVALHDATTVLYLLYPQLFSTCTCPVTIDCSEGINRGMTIGDRRLFAQGDGITVLTGVVDKVGYQNVILEGFKILDRTLS